ncbi:archaetidylserine decarboxylase [Reinekea sp.]|jgi:phosphatidylserine decarboxylase|uniref:archaetidylserine decarboxylase n=1 Tax=Reinekea sp. TaxID=1970455 RepID=UPI0039899709
MNLKDFSFITSQYLLPHHLLSRLVGYFAESELSFIKKPLMNFFLNRFGIDLSEAERESVNDYKNFNDFFTRSLKADIRPIEGNTNEFVSPVDGAVSQFGTIHDNALIQAKGRTYRLTDLLGGDTAQAELFADGEFATLYLSPKDYHRIHMPIAGKLVKTTFIPGKLFSVNQLTAENVPNLFARNERLVCEFETEKGTIIMVLVGAMIVASIETVWSGIVAPFQRKISQQLLESRKLDFERGEEIGRFRLGSTVILLTQKGALQWNDQIKNEANVKLGQILQAQVSDN